MELILIDNYKIWLVSDNEDIRYLLGLLKFQASLHLASQNKWYCYLCVLKRLIYDVGFYGLLNMQYTQRFVIWGGGGGVYSLVDLTFTIQYTVTEFLHDLTRALVHIVIYLLLFLSFFKVPVARILCLPDSVPNYN